MPFYLEMSQNINSAMRHLICSYFDFYKPSLDRQKTKKRKNYIRPDQIKNIKRTKSRLKRNIKMLLNRSGIISYVQVKQKNAKS